MSARKAKKKSKWTPRGFMLRVRKSKTGKGLFAEEEIPKGACVIEYTGRKVSDSEADDDRGKYFFDAGGGITLDGNVKRNLARYINHSCRPNCEADGPTGRVFIIAKRRIKAGEELFYDYGKEYFDAHLRPKGCRCDRCASTTTSSSAKTRSRA